MGLASAIPGVGLALGAIGAIGKLFGNHRANNDLKRLQGEDPSYSANPLSAQRLDLAKTMLNARAPGSAYRDSSIYTSGGNQRGFITRNSTDSSQNLALGAAELGQEEDAFNKGAYDDTQDYQRRFQNYVGAEEGVINEGDKVFGDQTRRFGDKVQIQGAINENRQNTWGSISNAGFGLADFGMNGGFGGKGRNRGN